MYLTKSGNVRIKINPERHYQGDFIGYLYFDRNALRKVFGRDDWSSLATDGNELGELANNDEMIIHHLQPFRRCGYTVE